MNCPLRCQCGLVQGEVDTRKTAARAVCYCKDCQAFARFLQREGDVLDRFGGTDIVATVPNRVRFTSGFDKVACMSLSERGLLRWYASCCRTPIGNTPRDRRIPYVGLVRACLAASDDDVARWFGTGGIALNAQSARGKVSGSTLRLLGGMLKIARNILSARFSGGYKDNPFFVPDSSEPVRSPRVLTPEERRALGPAL